MLILSFSILFLYMNNVDKKQSLDEKASYKALCVQKRHDPKKKKYTFENVKNVEIKLTCKYQTIKN